MFLGAQGVALEASVFFSYVFNRSEGLERVM